MPAFPPAEMAMAGATRWGQSFVVALLAGHVNLPFVTDWVLAARQSRCMEIDAL